MTVAKYLECRLNLGSANTHEEIEERLSKPLASPQVEKAFAESLVSWKAYRQPAPLAGKDLPM